MAIIAPTNQSATVSASANSVHASTAPDLARRVEAYREHWGIEPEDIRQPPIDAAQYHEWNAAVKTVEIIERINEPHLDHRLERGLGLEL